MASRDDEVRSRLQGLTLLIHFGSVSHAAPRIDREAKHGSASLLHHQLVVQLAEAVVAAGGWTLLIAS